MIQLITLSIQTRVEVDLGRGCGWAVPTFMCSAIYLFHNMEDEDSMGRGLSLTMCITAAVKKAQHHFKFLWAGRVDSEP